MTKQLIISLICVLGFAVGVQPAVAEQGPDLMSANVDIHDTASLQRGAKLFMNYCVGCHSLHFMRYSRLSKDLNLTEKEVMNNLNFTGEKFREPIVSAMPAKESAKWFGKTPPDLSLVVDEKGADWVYTYLNDFYLDPARPSGWNNVLFKNVSMPNVLWSLQGIQTPVYGEPDNEGDPAPVIGTKLSQSGSMTPSEYHQATRDITAFLDYVSEPAALKRASFAPWVLLYLAIFSVLAWFLKREFWKDVH